MELLADTVGMCTKGGLQDPKGQSMYANPL